MADEFTVMNLRVTRRASDAWKACAAEHGVTASALAEVIGEWMDPDGLTLSDVVARAAAIAESRRSRRPGVSGQGSGQGVGDGDT